MNSESAVPSHIHRTLWTCENVRELADVGSDRVFVDKEVRKQVNDIEQALLVGSLTVSGTHAPALDVDLPIMTVGVDELGTLVLFPGLTGPLEPWQRLIGALAGLGWHVPLDEEAFEIDPRYADGRPPDAGASLVETATKSLSEAVAKGGRALLLTVPVRVLPSSSPGHHHVYIDAELAWEPYKFLLECFRDAKLIEPTYVTASFERGMTMLIRQGLTKQMLASRLQELPSAERRRDSGGDGHVNDGW